MWLITKVMQLADNFYHRLIRHLNLTRKWSSMNRNERFIFLIVAFTLVITIFMALYSYITSNFYLLRVHIIAYKFKILLNYPIFSMKMNPRVKIHDRERSECCQGPTDYVDMCGRPDCIWPCPNTIDNQQLKFTTGNKAFVLETSGATYLDFRQACSVESLAFHNPNLTIYLLMTSPYLQSISMSALTRNYPNVHVISIDLSSYLTGTPFEKWYFCTEWNRGWYAVAHLSDALRLLTLSKYGGYYFDLDVIHIRPVTPYRNFAVAESDHLVANGILHADYQHPIMQLAADEFAANYE